MLDSLDSILILAINLSVLSLEGARGMQEGGLMRPLKEAQSIILSQHCHTDVTDNPQRKQQLSPYCPLSWAQELRSLEQG